MNFGQPGRIHGVHRSAKVVVLSDSSWEKNLSAGLSNLPAVVGEHTLNGLWMRM